MSSNLCAMDLNLTTSCIGGCDDVTTMDYRNIDFSKFNFSDEQEIWYKAPTWEIAVKFSIMIPIMLFGFLGNAAIILIVLKFRSMRTCTNMFIFNMAIADFMTLLCCPWITLISNFYQNYPLGSVICRLDGFIQVTFLLASVFSLIVIACDRLLGIVFPFSRRITKRMAIFIIIGIWISAMICACPLITFRTLKTRVWADYVEIWCSEDKTLEELRAYWFIMLVLLCYAPLTIVTIAYIVIILQMDRYEHKLFNRENPIKIKYRRKIIQMLFIYLLCFFWSWFLFQVTVFYRHFKTDIELPCWYRHVYFVAHLLAYANSAINPIIYGAKSESFMKAFRSVCPWISRKNKVAPSASPRGAVQLGAMRPQQTPLGVVRPQQSQLGVVHPQQIEQEQLGDSTRETTEEPRNQILEETKTKMTEETRIRQTQVECFVPSAPPLGSSSRTLRNRNGTC